ncbi:unnamed protein product [Eretmochelys imbricata]
MVLPIASSSMELQQDNGLCVRNSIGGCWLKYEEPRSWRDSIPPVQTPTAKHMLAYLPRPPTDTSRYGAFPQKPEMMVIPMGLSEDSQQQTDPAAEKKNALMSNFVSRSCGSNIPDDRSVLQRRLSMVEQSSTGAVVPVKHRPSVSINTEDLPKYHQASHNDPLPPLRDINTWWYPRHALSVPNIPNSARKNTPTRSIVSMTPSEPARRARRR